MDPISCNPESACCPRDVSDIDYSPVNTNSAAQEDAGGTKSSLQSQPRDPYQQTVIDFASLLRGGKLVVKRAPGLLALGVFGCSANPTGPALNPSADSGQPPDQRTQIIPPPAPKLLTPLDNEIFPSARVFSGWSAVNSREEHSTVFYKSCYADNSVGENFDKFSDVEKCPNEKNDASRFRVIEPLSKDRKYRFKVRTCYVDQQGNQQNARCGEYSPVREFSTDHSLVGWWKFDEGMGTVARDSSGNGNDGLLQNFDLTDPLKVWKSSPPSLHLDGSRREYVKIGDQTLYDFGTGDFALEARVNTTRISGDAMVIIHNSKGGYGGRGYILYVLNGRARMVVHGDIAVAIEGSTPVADGVWHHLAGVRIGNQLKLFVDGRPDAPAVDVTGLGNLDEPGSPLVIGTTGHTPSDGPFYGPLDEAAIYNRPLSPGGVKNNYCAIEALAGRSESDLTKNGCLQP